MDSNNTSQVILKLLADWNEVYLMPYRTSDFQPKDGEFVVEGRVGASAFIQ